MYADWACAARFLILSGNVGTGGTPESTVLWLAFEADPEAPAVEMGMGALAAAESRSAADDLDLNNLLILRFHPDCFTFGSGSGAVGSTVLNTVEAEGGSRRVFSGEACRTDRFELQVDGVGGSGPASNWVDMSMVCLWSQRSGKQNSRIHRLDRPIL